MYQNDFNQVSQPMRATPYGQDYRQPSYPQQQYQQPQQPYSQNGSGQRPKKRRKKKGRIWRYVLLLLLFAAGAFLGSYLAANNNFNLFTAVSNLFK
jgi:hypothetical protein